MTVAGWLFCLTLAQQQPGSTRPVSPDVVARFEVTVTASDSVTSRLYEYLQLVARRNTQRTRFGGSGTAPELELVLLFEDRPKMPWNRRDIGSVNLRLSPEDDLARVEYCMRRCREPEPELVVYTLAIDAFMKKLDTASGSLARRYR